MDIKRTTYGLIAVLIVAVAWPPVFFRYFSDQFRSRPVNQGQMRDFEIQRLLNANRWVLDVPSEKDGWFLELTSKSGDEMTSSGGVSVLGGTRMVLLVRRNTSDRRIEYAWYDTTTVRETIGQIGPANLVLTESHSGSGKVDDPLASASVLTTRAEGPIADGDWLYRGASKSLSSNEPAEFEVRVRLRDPAER